MAQASKNGRLSAIELSEAALTTVEELTGYKAEAVTGLEWDGEFWRVSVDRAREMGINWWESDASLKSLGPTQDAERSRLEQENGELRERLERIERALGVGQESEQ